jgi:hypothetical protein
MEQEIKKTGTPEDAGRDIPNSMEENILTMAKNIHELISLYRNLNSGEYIRSWDECTKEHKNSLIKGVIFRIEHPDAEIASLQGHRISVNAERGWKYGKKYSEEDRTNPDLASYDMLPENRKTELQLFMLAVDSNTYRQKRWNRKNVYGDKDTIKKWEETGLISMEWFTDSPEDRELLNALVNRYETLNSLIWFINDYSKTATDINRFIIPAAANLRENNSAMWNEIEKTSFPYRQREALKKDTERDASIPDLRETPVEPLRKDYMPEELLSFAAIYADKLSKALRIHSILEREIMKKNGEGETEMSADMKFTGVFSFLFGLVINRVDNIEQRITSLWRNVSPADYI